MFLIVTGVLPPMLHHKCERRACVNPFHLAPKQDDAEHKIEHRRTRCDAGHDLTDPTNVYMRRSRGTPSSPQCRPCKAFREKERRRALPLEVRQALNQAGSERRRQRRRTRR